MILNFLDSLLRSSHHHASVSEQILEVLKKIERKEDNIVSALTDLQGAVTRLNTSTSAELKAIADKLGSLGDSVTAADVEAAVTAINATADSLDAETAALAPPPPVA